MLYGRKLRVPYGSRLRVLYGSKRRVLYGTRAVCSTEHVYTQREIDMWTDIRCLTEGHLYIMRSIVLLVTVVINMEKR